MNWARCRRLAHRVDPGFLETLSAFGVRERFGHGSVSDVTLPMPDWKRLARVRLLTLDKQYPSQSVLDASRREILRLNSPACRKLSVSQSRNFRGKLVFHVR
jgi:hypothetical protein